jgi:hypothetical protein
VRKEERESKRERPDRVDDEEVYIRLRETRTCARHNLTHAVHSLFRSPVRHPSTTQHPNRKSSRPVREALMLDLIVGRDRSNGSLF